MKLTKFGHACFAVEDEDIKIIVDPGAYSTLPAEINNVAAVVVTHIHGDHFHQPHIQAIINQNPDVVVFGPKEVVAEIPGCIEPTKDKTYQAGPFSLNFYGDLHEVARSGKPQVNNLGVCINDLVAYPGDSYSQFSKPVKVIMAPVCAPWIHISKAYDFIVQAKAELTIPTHDGLLSDTGFAVYDAHLSEAAKETGSDYMRLNPGESVTI